MTDNFDLYKEAVKRLPAKHIDSHESDLYIKVTPESSALIDAYREILVAKYGKYADCITTFRSIHPDDKGAKWYDIPFHYTPFFTERHKNIPECLSRVATAAKGNEVYT